MKTSCLLLGSSLICASYETNILARLNTATGACIWTREVDGSVLATPVLVNNNGELDKNNTEYRIMIWISYF